MVNLTVMMMMRMKAVTALAADLERIAPLGPVEEHHLKAAEEDHLKAAEEDHLKAVEEHHLKEVKLLRVNPPSVAVGPVEAGEELEGELEGPGIVILLEI